MAIEQSSTKLCPTCKFYKPRAEFYSSKASKDGLASKCIDCARVYQRAWGRLHKDKKKAWHAAWYSRNRDAQIAKCRAIYAANRQQRMERQRAYRRVNLARCRAHDRIRALREDRRQQKTEWRRSHKESVAATKRRYRARKHRAEGFFSAQNVRDRYKAQRGRCAYCRRRLTKFYHVDHIIALARGGSNYPRNTQILCSKCNSKKWAKDPIDFAKELGLLI